MGSDKEQKIPPQRKITPLNKHTMNMISVQVFSFMKRLSECFTNEMQVTVLVRNTKQKNADLIFTNDDLAKVVISIDDIMKQRDH